MSSFLLLASESIAAQPQDEVRDLLDAGFILTGLTKPNISVTAVVPRWTPQSEELAKVSFETAFQLYDRTIPATDYHLVLAQPDTTREAVRSTPDTDPYAAWIWATLNAVPEQIPAVVVWGAQLYAVNAAGAALLSRAVTVFSVPVQSSGSVAIADLVPPF